MEEVSHNLYNPNSFCVHDIDKTLNFEIVIDLKRREKSFISSLDVYSQKTPDDKREASVGITDILAAELLEIYGKNELPEHIIPSWYIFLSQLWQPMPIMIWIAILIEIAIGGYIDMGILLFIQFANASIGFYEINKAGNAVAALKQSLKPLATVKRDGTWSQIDGTLVVPGDLVLLASGSAVPADCRVNEGEIEVDESSLTGESLPVTMFKDSFCRMGSTVVRGEVEGTVEFTGANTFFGKTAMLLGQSDELSNFNKLLMKIIMILVAISITLCIIVLIYLLVSGIGVLSALSFTVVLLVASIPLAVEIVTTTTLALGSKELSHHGAIVTRLAAIEDMAGMSILCSDKTGTLTMNKMEIQDETPIYAEGENQYTLLRYAAMAAKWKEPPRDALDTLTLNAVDMSSLDSVEQLSYMPFDPVVKRTGGTVRDLKTGEVFETTKGAPHIILKLINDQRGLVYIEDDPFSQQVENDLHRLGERGIRALAVAKTDQAGLWQFLGLLTFLDPPRPDTKQTIADAQRLGVAVKMVTGDHVLIARETAKALGMGRFVQAGSTMPSFDVVTKQKPENLARDYGDMCLAVDGFAQVFPEHKYLIVECLRELGYKVGMTGDGVNDAPALKRADVGVAVHGATDAARAAADIVFTQSGLSTIVHGIRIARCIFARIRNFLTYRIAATLQLLVFFFIAVFVFKPVDYMPTDWKTNLHFPDNKEWPLFFHMPVLMLMLITLLNDGTLITIGYDNVEPRMLPEKWNVRALFVVASVLAGVALMSSLLLLSLCLDSWQQSGLFQQWGIGGLSYGQITTAIYLKISISDFLTLFSARTGDDFFWTTRPAIVLLLGAFLALFTSTLVACVWPPSRPDNIYTLGLSRRPPYTLPLYIWLYCIVWWLIQDVAKVGTYWLLETYNICDYNSTGFVVLPLSAIQYRKDNKESAGLTTEDDVTEDNSTMKNKKHKQKHHKTGSSNDSGESKV